MDWTAFREEHHLVASYITDELRAPIERVAGQLISVIRNGGKILICGNGGSAADAQHFAAELVNRFLLNRAAWPVLALTTDSSVLTSVANDFQAQQIFSRQVEAFGKPEDALICISTSGDSPNIVLAAQEATSRKLLTVGLLGGTGGKLLSLVDEPLTIACSSHVPRIQEGHLMIIHALCELIEHELAH